MAFHTPLLFTSTVLLLVSLCNVAALEAGQKQPAKLGFSWENCGPASDPLQIKSLSVSPDPIAVPGNLTIGLTVNVGSALPTDIHASVTMEKKVGGFFVKVPCIDNFGSCTYGNLCQDWAQACPKYFEKYGLPCSCPIPANTYSIPDAVIEITAHLPSIGEGQYRITADLGSTTAHVGCIRLQVGLKG